MADHETSATPRTVTDAEGNRWRKQPEAVYWAPLDHWAEPNVYYDALCTALAQRDAEVARLKREMHAVETMVVGGVGRAIIDATDPLLYTAAAVNEIIANVTIALREDKARLDYLESLSCVVLRGNEYVVVSDFDAAPNVCAVHLNERTVEGRNIRAALDAARAVAPAVLPNKSPDAAEGGAK